MTIGRQTVIDSVCISHSLDIVCLQDVRIRSTTLQSANYYWLTSSSRTSGQRVSGFLIRKRLNCTVQPCIVSPNIQLLFVQYHDCSLILCNIYMPNDGSTNAFSSYQLLLDTIWGLRRQHPDTLILYCGDFNAHLGDDIMETTSRLTGRYLYHEESNENGEWLYFIMQSHKLVSCSTIFDSSTLITWYSGERHSQLDHVLIPQENLHQVTAYRGSWIEISDHKLITFCLHINPSKSD